MTMRSTDRLRRSLALATAAVAGLVPAAVAVAGPGAAAAGAAGSTSAFSVAEWASPSMTYRPGVRWWWSGGAVEDDVLDEQLDYLASHGFGTVEINPFGAEPVAGDEAAVEDIYTPAFYAHLEHAVAKAQDLGITVDLNMGSGWNANSQFVTEADGQQNMGLGRSTATGSALKAGGVAVPTVALSAQYDAPTAAFDPADARLQGVLVARRTGVVGTVTGAAASFDGGATTWDQRISVDPDHSFMIDAGDLGPGGVVDLPAAVASQVADGDDYEVVALYALPSDSTGVDSARDDWYVVNHMDAGATLDYLNDWLGEENLNRIVSTYDNIRAVFNDSLELSTDLYYDDGLYELARDAEHNGLGYDFSPYLPTVYRQNNGAPAYFTNQLSGSTTPYVTTTTDSAVQARILADFRVLVGERFAQGFRGFQKGAHAVGLQYRQQAYNPPLDEIGSAQYVDIPEEEQANEANLRTAASGGHLYDRDLVTAEQFTLGQVPLTNSLESLKVGFDLMATSGVNNFFYHGFAYPYGRGSEEYGESGWSAFPTIGVDPSSNNTLSPYFGDLNAYAARLNYLGQQGDPSMDVAVYAPYGTKAPTTGAVPVLNTNGYAWDAINDASISADDTTYAGGRISVNGGAMTYDALVVQSQSVPVATMQHLLALAEQGAPIIFYNALPSAQPGYADGAYAAEDAKVAALATRVLVDGDASAHPTSATALANSLRRAVDPELTYDANDSVRFVRRDLADGGALTFLRNTGTTTTTITLRADERYQNFYWLDQATGRVHAADVVDGTLTFTLDAGQDALSGFGGSNPNRSHGIALLAEPAGVTLPASAITAGVPDGVDRVEPDATQPVTPTSLTVTADNLDGTIGGAEQTATFTDDVLGNWKDASFHGGQLQSVVSDGTYTATVEVTKAKGRRYLLDLGQVYTAASVTVNGTKAGDVLFAPYEVDVTDQLRSGSNTIEVTVTPRRANRFYPAATNADGQLSTASPVDAGLVGPITLDSSAVAASTAPAATTAPQVTGTARVGGTLTASPGAWDVAGTSYAYQWLRDGAAIAGATAATYRVVPADAGTALSVRVTATATGYRPGTATSAARPVARVAATARVRLGSARVAAGRRARVSVTVSAAGLTPTGRATITRDGRAVATVVLRDGRATVRLPKAAVGRYRISVRYAGDAHVRPSTSKPVVLQVVRRR